MSLLSSDRIYINKRMCLDNKEFMDFTVWDWTTIFLFFYFLNTNNLYHLLWGNLYSSTRWPISICLDLHFCIHCRI